MTYQSNPVSLVNLLDKLIELSCWQGWWELADKQKDAGDDNNASAKETEG